MSKLIASTILACTALTAAPAFAAEECGDISIAEMNWASAGLAAQVDKLILENAYGCDVTVVTGDTMPTFTSMNEKGEPDIAPELWVNAVKDPLDKAVDEGRLVIASEILSDGGIEGWWIPKYMADAHPDIKTVEDALAHSELFPAPENPEKGAVHNCPAGWNCQLSTANLYRAYGAEEKGFDLVDTGSGAGLVGTIAGAYEREKGWLGYYWSPTAVLGKYDMVKLDAGVEVDVEEFNSCTAMADCADPKPNAYPVAAVYTVVTKELAEKAGGVMDYLGTRQWDNDTVNAMLAWKDDNQATSEDMAYHFLENYSDLWTSWLTEDQIAKVQDAL